MTTTLRSTLLLVLAAAAIAAAAGLPSPAPSAARAHPRPGQQPSATRPPPVPRRRPGPDTDNVQAGDQSAPTPRRNRASPPPEACPASEASGAEGASAEPAGAATPRPRGPAGSNVDAPVPAGVRARRAAPEPPRVTQRRGPVPPRPGARRVRDAVGSPACARRRCCSPLLATARGRAPSATASAAVPAAAAVRPLHAEPDAVAAGRIVDGRGREVLLRGVRVDGPAEYRRGRRSRRRSLARAGSGRMRGSGWDAVRLLVSWSRVEPAPGRYDERYLDLVARTARRLGREGLASWSMPTRTRGARRWPRRPGRRARPGERRRWAGTERRHGRRQDGGPRAATAGRPRGDARGAAPRGAPSSPTSGGVRRRFVAMWGHVARRMRSVGAVVGYDLLNEPGALDADAQQALSGIYADALAAIRAGPRPAEARPVRAVGRLVRHGPGAPPAFRHDADVVYAPHIYTGGFTTGRSPRRPSRSRATRRAASAARRCSRASGGPARSAPGRPTTTSSPTRRCRTASGSRRRCGPGARAAATRTRWATSARAGSPRCGGSSTSTAARTPCAASGPRSPRR